jgi:hypothetical protein
MSNVGHLPVIGINLFCPDCKRELISFNPNGTFNLAGQAEIRGSAEQILNEHGEVEEPQEMVVTQARCLRRSCRARRWLRTHNPRRA